MRGRRPDLAMIMAIRRDYLAGYTQVALAQVYRLRRQTVARVVAGAYPGLSLCNLSRGRGAPGYRRGRAS